MDANTKLVPAKLKSDMLEVLNIGTSQPGWVFGANQWNESLARMVDTCVEFAQSKLYGPLDCASFDHLYVLEYAF